MSLDEIIDHLSGSGYQPLDAIDLAQPRVARTLDYFHERGWHAARVLADSVQLARWSDDGAELLNITPSGCIVSEARFSVDRHGLRMFVTAADCRP